MNDFTGSDRGAGTVHTVQAIIGQRVDDAYKTFICHTQDCAECRSGGVDCATAAELRQAWRDARTTAAEGHS